MKRQLFFLSLSLLFISCSYAHQTLVMSPGAFQAPSDLRVQSVLHDEDGFHILRDNIVHPVQRHDVDAKIRNMRQDQLSAFLKAGYLKVNKLSDGSYKIGAHVRGVGGGPLLATLFYGATKGIIYGSMAASSTAGLIAVGTTVGAAVGGENGAQVGAMAGGALSSTLNIVASGSPIIAGAATTSGSIVSGAVGANAAMATTTAVGVGTGIVATGGNAVAFKAGVEMAAVTMWHIGMWIPWL